jgi:hypothetical protein
VISGAPLGFFFRSFSRVVLLGAVLLVPGGCGGKPAPGQEQDTRPTETSSQVSTELPTEMNLTQQTEFARAELAERLGVEVEALRLLEAEHVHWSDSSLGCPLPDRGYMQVITPGVLIRFAYGKVVYEYHAGRSGKPFLCEPPGTIQRPATVSPPSRGFDDGT